MDCWHWISFNGEIHYAYTIAYRLSKGYYMPVRFRLKDGRTIHAFNV